MSVINRIYTNDAQKHER